MKRKSVWVGVALALPILLMIGRTLLTWIMAPQSPGPLDRISIGSTLAYYSLPILVAEEQGYFVRNGLGVTMKLYENGTRALNGLARGEFDFATASEFGFVSKTIEGGDENLRIIASVATSFSEEIVARRDHGILNLADLKGKRVGIPHKSAVDFSFYRFLILQRIPPEEITLVDLSYAHCAEMISQGEIDATVLFDYYLYKTKKQLGANAVSWSARSTQDFYWLLVGKMETIEAKPAVVERLLAALMEAQEFIRAHREAAESILVKRWQRDPEFLPHARKTSKIEVSLEQALILAMEDAADWIAEKRLAGKKPTPNYFRFIYMDALDAVKPKANTIIR